MPETKPRHATAITVINLKGGVGKTHTVWLLAGVCQERGKKLLVIDTDTQGNITTSLLAPARNPVPGVAALFDPHTDIHPGNLIRPTRYSHVDLLPSNPLLARDRPFADTAPLQGSRIALCMHCPACKGLFVCSPIRMPGSHRER
jgi:cellulose biosynthesis protein BcsQ